MDNNQLYLFKDRRFLPLFITQFCGCFNDNVLKNALIILVAYRASVQGSLPAHFLILLINAIFIAPFILFAGIAGQLADKFERVYLVNIIKFVEIFIVIFSIYSFYINNLTYLLISIGLMGVHSTFFGPLKYSMLCDSLKKVELLGANGYVEAGTFISILLGTIVGGFYTNLSYMVIFALISVSLIGLASSFAIPKSNNYNPELEINYNIFQETLNIIRYSTTKKQVFLSILGISWFWFIGGALLSQIPTLTRDTFGADENVTNLFLATFSIGVGVGSFWCNRLFENEITTKYVFISAIGISVFGMDLFFASRISAIHHEPEYLKNVLVFLSKRHNWRILFDLFAIATIGGLYVVPLYAVMQYFSAPAYRSRVIAANNVINAVFMVFSTAMLSLMLKLECSIPFIILLISLINLFIAGYIYQFLPEVKIFPVIILKSIFKFIFDKVYRVEVHGLENLTQSGKRVVIVANHISYLDPALLAVYLPTKLAFAINTYVAKEPWIRPFMGLFKTYPVDPNNAMAVKSLINEVKKNQKIVIFPEGRITTTGCLMKVYEGPGMIADKADAAILPIRIDGPQYTFFSKLRNLPRTKIFPKVKITILPAVKLESSTEEDNRITRRGYISRKLYDIMSEMMFESSSYHRTLFQSAIDTAKIQGLNRVIVQDVSNSNLTYRQFLLKSFVLGKMLLNKIGKKKNNNISYIGLMLPNSTSTAVAFFGCQAYNIVPAMINFTAGVANVLSVCETANINIICTSKEFIKKAGLDSLASQISEHLELIYLEDLRDEVTLGLKIRGFIASIFPQIYYSISCKNQKNDSPAVVLFTSGTEDKPKAVLLSHTNLQANRYQIAARVDFTSCDVAFNALPMFHTFGLTVTLLAILNGIKVFLYPSPLHYKIIPEVIYDIGATVMFATDTFLNGYSKYAHPYDFYSLRRIFAGAEKLKSETQKLWFEKYGVRIFEGYGATEASPVISMNTAMHDKVGSVGRLMPKIEYFIRPIEGISDGGELCIRGPNVMLGYLFPDKPGVLVPPSVEGLGQGWYDTGDIVSINDEGFVTILGRAKRFAKIAGEMLSLTIVEEIASIIDAKEMHAAVHIDDDNRGEQIVLCTSSQLVTREKMIAVIQDKGITELYTPKIIIYLDPMPTLATGKKDYRKIADLAVENVNLSKNVT